MNQSIADEIKQTKPFSSSQEELLLTLQHTADTLARPFESLFKSHGISGTQFNVLRILRGAGSAGLRCGEIGDRMVTHDPDITRLLDRLEKSGFIERGRDTVDRRVVITRIKRQGLQLLAKLDEPVRKLAVDLLGELDEKQVRRLIDGLNEIRSFANKQE